MGAEQFPLTPAAAKEAQRQYTALANREDELLAELAKGNVDRAKELKAKLETGITALSERLISPLERNLKLKEQHESQAALWESSVVGEKMKAAGHEFPRYDQLRAAIRNQQEVLGPKAEQGFKKLIIVPSALSIPELSEAYGSVITRHKAEGSLKGANGEDLELDAATPVWRWDGYDKEQIVYEPERFDKKNPGGKTKEQMISEHGAWQVLLVEERPEIPRAGDAEELGTKTKRKQLEAGKTPNEYLALLGKGQYAHEQGLTPEAWLALAITRLEETNTVLDDYNGGGSACYNLGAYFPASAYVSYCSWVRAYQRAYVSDAGPDGEDPDYGVRSSVRVELGV